MVDINEWISMDAKNTMKDTFNNFIEFVQNYGACDTFTSQTGAKMYVNIRVYNATADFQKSLNEWCYYNNFTRLSNKPTSIDISNNIIQSKYKPMKVDWYTLSDSEKNEVLNFVKYNYGKNLSTKQIADKWNVEWGFKSNESGFLTSDDVSWLQLKDTI